MLVVGDNAPAEDGVVSKGGGQSRSPGACWLPRGMLVT